MRNGDPRLLSAGITRNSTFEADSGALREFVEQLQSRVGELQERIVELQEHIVEVERKIGRNSNNSSLPPSRDDAAAREERVNRAARRRAAPEARRRKPGKQPGDPGTHLAQVADPDQPGVPTLGTRLDGTRHLPTDFPCSGSDSDRRVGGCRPLRKVTGEAAVSPIPT